MCVLVKICNDASVDGCCESKKKKNEEEEKKEGRRGLPGVLLLIGFLQ